MDEITRRRIEKIPEASTVKPEDALEYVREKIAGKKARLLVAWFEEVEDGKLRHEFCVSALNYPEAIALMQVTMQVYIAEWLDEGQLE